MIRKAVMAIIAVALILSAAGTSAEVIERIVAKVNGDIILLSELEDAFRPVAEEIRARAQGAQATEQLRRARNQVLENLIDERLLVQKAAESGIEVDNSEIDDAVTRLRQESGLTDDTRFAQALAAENIDLETLRSRLRSQMLASRVQIREVRGKVNVTDGDIASYYERNPDKYSSPSRLRLQVLLLEIPQGSSQLRRTQVEAKRDEIVAALARGEDFGELVKMFSDGPSPASGGDIGFVARDDLAPEFAAVAFELDKGQVSAPFDTPFGITFVKVTDKQDTGRVPLKDVSDQIRQELYQERLQSAALAFADALHETAFIEKMP